MPLLLQDYHNLRAAAFNSQNQALANRTAELRKSQEAAAQLRDRVHELEGQLQAKEQERSQPAAERNRLEKGLADQATRHVEQVQQLKDGEERLKAEFESQRSGWAEKEKYLSEGYSVIEGLLKEYFSDHPGAINQAIEARRDQ